jgi:hypothetical protein
MSRGPFALGLFVLMALAALSTVARAAEDAGVDDAPAWCVRGIEPDHSEARPERTLVSVPLDVLALSLGRARAGVPSATPDPLTCIRRGLGSDCQVHDPADRPTPAPVRAFGAPDLASASVPAVPEPDAARAPLPPGALGAARPGFVRELLRPPRV